MKVFAIRFGVAFLVGLILLLLEHTLARRNPRLRTLSQTILSVLSAACVVAVTWLVLNHIGFPLHLDLMEGTVLQHVERAGHLEPIYTSPSPEYVPLAYNPLYYVICAPFTWIFGMNLPLLRLVAIIGFIGSALAVFLAVWQLTKSRWWGLVALGLFAASYQVMDVYLDTAHSDSWLVCSALWGTYLIGGERSFRRNMVGLLLLVASFWFKQHGAFFAAGGLAYLTIRDGWRRSVPFWLTTVVLGPLAYLWAGPVLFGEQFHYFTWTVPAAWQEINLQTFRRFAGFIVKFHGMLALGIGLAFCAKRVFLSSRPNVWEFQIPFALLTGLLGAMDPGSSDNVFIPMSTWLILLGVLSWHELTTGFAVLNAWKLDRLALLISFGLVVFDPTTVAVSAESQKCYGEFVAFLRQLDGPVYAPTLGHLSSGYTFYPAAHWVAIEDMIRGPGRDTENHPVTRKILDPIVHPSGPAYILVNRPLDTFPFFRFLSVIFVLEEDLGDRFRPLRALPKRFDHLWPRYLYRYAPNQLNGGPQSEAD